MLFRKKVVVPIEVSARHCHLSKRDLEALFGVGYELRAAKQLTQPADFACEETLNVEVNSHILENVRIVGPLREQTQVEISKTDAFFLGAKVPVRLSGSLEGSAPTKLVGPKGQIDLPEGLIIARRHVHCSPDEAKKSDLRAGQIISVDVKGDRAVTFHCIEVRVLGDYKLCLHLDTDEGNAAGINKVGEGAISVFKAKKE